MFSLFEQFFSFGGEKKTYLKCRLLFRSQIFKFCCDIQGSHLIGYLWVSLIIDQSECLICYFLCTELTLFCTELTLSCTELSETCIYLNQSELSNFSMYIITNRNSDRILVLFRIRSIYSKSTHTQNTPFIFWDCNREIIKASAVTLEATSLRLCSVVGLRSSHLKEK